MTLQDMTDLILISDAEEELEQIMVIMYGTAFAVGYDEGALGKISRVFDVIWRNCRLYNDKRSIEECLDGEGRNIFEILKMDLPAEERAKLLL